MATVGLDSAWSLLGSVLVSGARSGFWLVSEKKPGLWQLAVQHKKSGLWWVSVGKDLRSVGQREKTCALTDHTEEIWALIGQWYWGRTWALVSQCGKIWVLAGQWGKIWVLVCQRGKIWAMVDQRKRSGL
jgi:hypothetical protein